MESSSKLAFLGLGVMGSPDGRTSRRARATRVTVYNRTRGKGREMGGEAWRQVRPRRRPPPRPAPTLC